MPDSAYRPGEGYRLGAGVPELAALGARAVADLLEGTLETADRAELVARDAGSTLWRLPLPGTPDEWGKRHERPRGAGTGHVHLRRYERAGFADAFGARLSPPRSTSMAAREWNLICHLRSHGVSTPEPLAVAWESTGWGGAGFARRSAIVTRELEKMRSLPEWYAAHPDAEERRELALALDATLERTLAAGVWLPRLAARDLYVSAPGDDGCSAGPPVAGLAVSRLPEVALAGFGGGRLRRRMSAEARARWLARFDEFGVGAAILGRA